jgi:hypothetical protein
MKMRYVFIFAIGLVILMQTMVLALIPPPPANQNMGMYDTLFVNVTESGCRNCHASGVSNTHHNIVSTGEYGYINCHLTGGTGQDLACNASAE